MTRPSTFRNMFVALTVICLVCSALLGVVYGVTEEPIAASRAAKENAAIAAVTPEFDNVPSENPLQMAGGTVYTATKGGEVVGYAIKVSTSGFGGQLQLMAGFTPDGTIYNTSIISNSETPGLGAKITDPEIAPRKQVIGKNPAEANLTVSGDGGEIDAITASTITSRAFLRGVNAAYDVFKEIKPAEEATNTETDE